MIIMFTVRVSATGRDVRGLRKWSHTVRSGAEVTAGCSGVVVEPGLVLAPIGSLLDGWSDVTVSVNGKKAVKWVALDASSEFWDFRFCLISCNVEEAPPPQPVRSAGSLTVEQFVLHLTHPLWGLLVQPCSVVASPNAAVFLIDVSCYEGGEGGLVRGGATPMIVARGLSADNAPTGLSVCVPIPFLLQKHSGVPWSSGPRQNNNIPIVVVRGLEGRWGTGFQVGTDGTVVTAAHVVCNRNEKTPERVVIVRNAGTGSSASALVEHCWPGGWLDLCVLKTGAHAVSLSLADVDPVPGDNVRLLSATQWHVPMQTDGSVMSSSSLGLQLICNNIAWGGCSGGPLVHKESGRVGGLLVSTAGAGRIRKPRLSLVLPVSLWRRFVIGGQNERMEDAELQAKVESLWQNEVPDLPPRFKDFVSKL